MIKFIFTCLILIAAAQAIRHSNVKKVQKFRGGPIKGSVTAGRIWGGGFSKPHQFPFQVAIIADEELFCGASLISSNVVLTSAYCAHGYSSFEVHLGAHEIVNHNEEGRVIVRTSDATIHPDFSTATTHHDIAFLVLPEPQLDTPEIQVVRLPPRFQPKTKLEGKSGTVLGWGADSDTNPTVNPILKWAEVFLISNEECAKTYGNFIDNAKLCIGTNEGMNAPCQGDSGGPLVVREEDHIWTQVGIVSYGPSTGCDSGYPVVTTRVASYIEWLIEEAKITVREN